MVDVPYVVIIETYVRISAGIAVYKAPSGVVPSGVVDRDVAPLNIDAPVFVMTGVKAVNLRTVLVESTRDKILDNDVAASLGQNPHADG